MLLEVHVRARGVTPTSAGRRVGTSKDMPAPTLAVLHGTVPYAMIDTHRFHAQQLIVADKSTGTGSLGLAAAT